MKTPCSACHSGMVRKHQTRNDGGRLNDYYDGIGGGGGKPRAGSRQAPAVRPAIIQ
jgi:hypothetical protein